MFDVTKASKDHGEATAISFNVSAINMYGASPPVPVIYACKHVYIIEYVDVDEIYITYCVFTF